MTDDARVYNTAPRPRMIVRGFDDDSNLLERLVALVPTYTLVNTLREVAQEEWDLLVTDQQVDAGGSHTGPVPVAPHMFVIFKSPSPGHTTVETSKRWRGNVSRSMGHIRRELRRVNDLPSRVRPLVEGLEPVLSQRESHEYFYLQIPTASTVDPTATPDLVDRTPPTLEAFASTKDGKVLAGRYRRSRAAEAWLLPSDVPDFVAWVSAALGEWHTLNPDRFPGSPDWTHQRAWSTPLERSLLDGLAGVADERVTVLAALDARKQQLSAELTSARQDGDRYERALLTEQGDALVHAVHRALTELGFRVEDADASSGGERLEDLRVGDPDEPEWTAIAEVKGYGKGAQTGALTQFLRFQSRFRERTGRFPDALWYIANQFRDRDPVGRQTILQSNSKDVANFGEGGGLVIDTVELFRLLDSVRTGALTQQTARLSLRRSSGRFVAADPKQTVNETSTPN